MKKIIESIKKTLNEFFEHGINFTEKGFGKYISNDFWFEKFWIYIEINFIKIPIESNLDENQKGISRKDYLRKLSETNLKIGKDYFKTFITISILQGDYSGGKTIPLFRAEWDTYENNILHPQPHWHFYSNQYLEETYTDLIQIFGKDKDFSELINQEKIKGIDLQKIHFAMNGQWVESGKHIHIINKENTIIYWFQGVINHIKSQLEYIM